MDIIGGSLQRTFNPKYTHYAPDGIGRDSYIICNNGGLLPHDNYTIPHVGFIARETPS